MKPIVIIKETNKDGKFELTEKELKELIEQAYKQGFEDGKAQYQPDINSWHIRGISDKPSTPTYPRDIYGNPVPYCISTESDPRDNIAVPNTILNSESNDLVYRGWEHNYKFPKESEPIPCYDTPGTCGTTTGQPNPTTKLNGSAISTGV